MDLRTLASPVDNSPEVHEVDARGTRGGHDYSDDHSYKTGVEVVPNYRTRTREAEADWSPSEPRPAVAYWASIARAGIAAGRVKADERQAELDARNTRKDRP
jgi:hypothetical protein